PGVELPGGLRGGALALASAGVALRRHPPRPPRTPRPHRPRHGHHRAARHRLVGDRARSQRPDAPRVGRRRRRDLRGLVQGSLRAAAAGDLRVSPLLTFAVLFALGCYAVASVLVLIRLIGGPRAQDRVFALDLLYFHGMLVMLVL